VLIARINAPGGRRRSLVVLDAPLGRAGDKGMEVGDCSAVVARRSRPAYIETTTLTRVAFTPLALELAVLAGAGV
jgi:hypothetical protein